MTVTKLAKRAGVSRDAVRYYERTGLLPAVERSGSGYRLYEEGMLDRLRFIKGAQRTGLALGQIRELLEVIDRGSCPCGHTEALVTKRISQIDDDMKELRALRKLLSAVKQDLSTQTMPSASSEPWPCARTFIEVGRRSKGVRSGHGKAPR